VQAFALALLLGSQALKLGRMVQRSNTAGAIATATYRKLRVDRVGFTVRNGHPSDNQRCVRLANCLCQLLVCIMFVSPGCG
jgi:hypothetical protein